MLLRIATILKRLFAMAILLLAVWTCKTCPDTTVPVELPVYGWLILIASVVNK